MKETTEEEFSLILEYLNKHTNPTQTLEIEKRRRNEPEWEQKIQEVEQMQFKYRYVEAEKHLSEVFEKMKQYEKITDSPIIIVWWRRPAVWVAAASITFLGIFGAKQYNEWQKEKEELARIEKEKQEQLDKEKQLQTPPADLATKIPTLLAEPVELKGISDKMKDKMTALNDAIDEVAQQNAIRDLEDMGKPVKVPQERPTGETYGAGSESGSVPTPKTRPQITASEEQYRRLLLGIGYLRGNQLDKALKNLNEVNSAALQSDVAWYKSLVLIQQKKYAEAKIALLKIESNTQYGQKAKELLAGIPE
jgi:tetratricopeptide (TPR) repeat protein